MSSEECKAESAPNKIVVEVVPPDAAVDPIVVSFPGVIPNTIGNDPPKFAWRKLVKKGRSLIGKDATCVYQADSSGDKNEDKRLTKLCVGIYNKKTGKLTLHQTAEEGNVFSLEQSVLSYEGKPLELPAKMTGADRRKALFESFGSSKKQKVLKSQAANVVNVDTVVGSGDIMREAFFEGQDMSESNRKALEELKSGIKTDPAELAYAEARRKFLPPFDVDAKEPHRVYDARDIAGDAAWGQVSRVIDVCYAKDGNLVANLTSRGTWHESVTGVLKGIKRDSPNAKFEFKCAILMNNMINFYHRTVNRNFIRGTAIEIAEFMKFPIEIATRFLQLFTTTSTGERGEEGFCSSKQTRDKCLVHIFLLYLMAHGNEMKVDNIVPLARDVKIEIKEAGILLRSAGCTVKSRGPDVVTAALTVPLTFPPPKRGRGPS